jgi:hyperosmotically inducible periplasmic protein
MNATNVNRLLAFGLAMALSMGAYAQASATDQAASTSARDQKSANRKLQRDVLKVLAKTRGLVSTAITVRANDGDVTLEGAVPEESQMTLASRAAESVQGVKSVKNMLTLSQF